MADRKITIGSHIDLNVIEADRRKTREATGRILDLLETKFHASDQAALFGRLMMGTDHKVEKDEKGRSKKVPIGIADVTSFTDALQSETEEKARRSVIAAAQEAIGHQADRFARANNSATRERSESRLAFVQAVIERFQAQPLPNAGWTWSKVDPSYTRDQQLLKDFTDLVTPQNLRLYGSSDVERRMRQTVVSQRHSSTWMAILKREGELFKKYMDEIAQEKAASARKAFDVANRLVRGQEVIFDDDTVANLEAASAYTQTVATDLASLPSFESVLPFFLERFPQAVSFREILVPKNKPAA